MADLDQQENNEHEANFIGNDDNWLTGLLSFVPNDWKGCWQKGYNYGHKGGRT
jgi:hypothetical protein